MVKSNRELLQIYNDCKAFEKVLEANRNKVEELVHRSHLINKQYFEMDMVEGTEVMKMDGENGLARPVMKEGMTYKHWEKRINQFLNEPCDILQPERLSSLQTNL